MTEVVRGVVEDAPPATRAAFEVEGEIIWGRDGET